MPTFVYIYFFPQDLFPKISYPYRPVTYFLNSHSFIILTFSSVPYLSIIVLSLCHSLYHPHAILIYHQNVTSSFSVSRRSRHQRTSHSSLVVASCILAPRHSVHGHKGHNRRQRTYIYPSDGLVLGLSLCWCIAVAGHLHRRSLPWWITGYLPG